MKKLFLSMFRRTPALPKQGEWNHRMLVAASFRAEEIAGRNLTPLERRFFLDGYHGRIPRENISPENDGTSMMDAILDCRCSPFNRLYFREAMGERSVQRLIALR